MSDDRLLKESLKEFGISSNVKTILEDITHEEPVFIQEEYWIPERYNETKIVLLSVDPHWQFVYWDIKDSLYEVIKDYSIQFRVICCGEEKLKINLLQQYGKYYFKFHAPFKEVYCILGYEKEDDFIEISRSNSFILPSDEIFEGKEVFLTPEDIKKKKEEIDKILKKSEILKGKKEEILKKSLKITGSSENLI